MGKWWKGVAETEGGGKGLLVEQRSEKRREILERARESTMLRARGRRRVIGRSIIYMIPSDLPPVRSTRAHRRGKRHNEER